MREMHIGGRRFPTGLLLAVVGPACVVILGATAQRAMEGYQLARQVEATSREVVELREENVRLQEEIQRNRSDAYVERIAREELNLVRPGDVPLIIVAPTPPPTPNAAARATPTPEVSVPRQWLRHFLDEP